MFTAALTPVVALVVTAALAVPAPAGPVQAVSDLIGAAASPAGAGVRVAVIDSGIAVEPAGSPRETNPCFADDGLAPLERSGQVQYTNHKVVVARSYPAAGGQPLYPGGPVPGEGLDARARTMHGSHVAGIIACRAGTVASVNGVGMALAGVAADATLGSYNVFPGLPVDGVGPSDDHVAQAIADAVADGMQVINVSLDFGRRAAPRTRAAIEDAYRDGVITVVAAGNGGPAPRTIGSPANSPDAVTVGSLETGWGHRAQVRVGGRRLAGFVADGITVSTPVRSWLMVTRVHAAGGRSPGWVNPLRLSDGCRVADYSGAAGRVAVVARGACPFSQKIDRAARARAAGVLVVSPDEAFVDPLGTGGRQLPAMVVGLSVGRLLARADGQPVALDPPSLTRTGPAGALSSFSSTGPTVSGLAKPDVLAPGGGLLSASAGVDCGPLPACFAVESGTSMAAPVVSGVVATVIARHPAWSAAMVRSAVIHTAVPLPGIPLRAQGVGVVSIPGALGARLGLDATGVGVPQGGTRVVRVLNPGPADVVVTVGISPSSDGRAERAVYAVPRQVTVPAGGSAQLAVSVTGGRVGDAAMMTLSLADGYAIRAVVSTVRN